MLACRVLLQCCCTPPHVARPPLLPRRTAYLSWLCGGPSTGLPTGGDTGMLHAGVDASAAAASALFTAIPCSKVPGVLQTPAMAEAVRHVSAMEQILAGWGTKVRRALPLYRCCHVGP